jgi:hypothetical protein
MEGFNRNWFSDFVKDCMLFKSRYKKDWLYGFLMWIVVLVLGVTIRNLLVI